MKQALRRLATRVFLGDKFRGRLATVIAGTAASYLLAYIPMAPEIVELVVRLIIELPEGVEFTHKTVTASLAVPVSYAIDAAIQEFLIRQNNKTLRVLREPGEYTGPLDGLVGPVARESIERILEKAYLGDTNPPQTDDQ